MLRKMSDAGLDLELVVSEDSAVTIPAADLARLPVLPGQRVRVHVESAASPRRSMLGALAKAGRPVVSLEDFDAVSDELWGGTDYGRLGDR
jgi:hypothetical protein